MPMLATRGSGSVRSLALDGPQRVRRTFSYVSNALQTFTVPANVTVIGVDVAGGGGGGTSNDYRGGGPGGALVSGKMTVTPGATLHLAVAQAGEGGYMSLPDPVNIQNLGGWPGGANGGAPTWNYYPSAFAAGGAGGGYSGVFSAGSLTQGNAIIVAGGGGGSGDGGSIRGGNATVSAGGAAGGAGQPNNTAQAGSALQGGEGDANGYVNPAFSHPAGGGGGGYFGGGGGYSPDTGFAWGGGGNGSSYTTAAVVPALVTDGVNAFNGYITLSW